MDTQELMTAAVPAIATGAAAYVVARATRKAENAKAEALAHASVEIAEIAAHTADQRTLLDYMHQSDARHMADVDRLMVALDRCRVLESDKAELRSRLARALADARVLRKAAKV